MEPIDSCVEEMIKSFNSIYESYIPFLSEKESKTDVFVYFVSDLADSLGIGYFSHISGHDMIVEE